MKFIKKNIYIIGAFAFLIVALAVSGLVIFFNKDVHDSDSTAIGHIYLGNMSTEERKQAIKKGLNDWEKSMKDSEGYVITYQNMTMHFIVSDYIYYNEEMTISNISKEKGDKNKAYMFPNSGDGQSTFKDLEKEIGDYFFGNIPVANRPNINFGTTNEYALLKEGNFWYDVLTVAGQFYSNYEFDLYDYLTTTSNGRYDETITVTLDTTGYEKETKNIIDEFNKAGKVSHINNRYDSATDSIIEEKVEYIGISVKSGEEDLDGFSLLEYTEKMNLGSTELSILGTGITGLAMQSNFANIRRYADKGIPSYTLYNIAETVKDGEGADCTDTYGIATRISRPNNQDLTFFNSDAYGYNIKLVPNADYNELKLVLMGTHSVKNYTISQTITTKNFTIDTIVNEGIVAEKTQDAFDAKCVEYQLLGYTDMTNNDEFLTNLELVLGENQKVFYYETAGINGAEVTFYRTYTATTEKKIYDENNQFTGKYEVIKNVVTEKVFKDAAYQAQAQKGKYVIVSLVETQQGL